MCGIFTYLTTQSVPDLKRKELATWAERCRSRGPDSTRVEWFNNNTVMMAFHRLSINDTSDSGMQPFHVTQPTPLVSITNGEIYNHLGLRTRHNLQLQSNSDTEVVAPLIQRLGLRETAQVLDGVFAFTVLDPVAKTVMVGRDPIGVRSLYYGTNERGEMILASEMKSIPPGFHVRQFPPGSTGVVTWGVTSGWQFTTPPTPYCTLRDIAINPGDTPPPVTTSTTLTPTTNETEIITNIRTLLEKAVRKRMMSDRPIGCLLSGGLDSSIIVALLHQFFQLSNRVLRTFSVGMKGSVDLIAARRVADYLGTDHTEVILTETEMFTAIPDTVYQIESYDTTTVRASTPMFLLCKWIKQHTDITVIFSGEGSDEASGSYQYFHGAPNPAAFQGEIERLMADLSYFDVLRCDKCSAGAGLEVRVPFLDRDFLQYYCQINPALKIPGRGVGRQRMEKRLLRLACQDLLPDDIAWRSKEGMSDGVSTMEKPWYSVIQDRVSQLHPTSEPTDEATGFNPPQFPEAAYYRSIFNQHYQGRDTTIPYYWLPRWSGNTKDPSARKLATYQSSTLEKTSNQKNLSIT